MKGLCKLFFKGLGQKTLQHTAPPPCNMKQSKMKICKGLFGVSSKGVLHTPSGKFLIWLPPFIAFKLHMWLNNHVDIGLVELNTK